jgi:hypothetical protein
LQPAGSYFRNISQLQEGISGMQHSNFPFDYLHDMSHKQHNHKDYGTPYEDIENGLEGETQYLDNKRENIIEEYI